MASNIYLWNNKHESYTIFIPVSSRQQPSFWANAIFGFWPQLLSWPDVDELHLFQLV
jgi:hypothetical protein